MSSIKCCEFLSNICLTLFFIYLLFIILLSFTSPRVSNNLLTFTVNLFE